MAQDQSPASSDQVSAPAFTPSQLPVKYSNPADTDCALRVQAAILNASGIEHHLRSFDSDDRVILQSQHKRTGMEAATIPFGPPSVTFARVYPSRETGESYPLFHPAGRAPPVL